MSTWANIEVDRHGFNVKKTVYCSMFYDSIDFPRLFTSYVLLKTGRGRAAPRELIQHRLQALLHATRPMPGRPPPSPSLQTIPDRQQQPRPAITHSLRGVSCHLRGSCGRKLRQAVDARNKIAIIDPSRFLINDHRPSITYHALHHNHKNYLDNSTRRIFPCH